MNSISLRFHFWKYFKTSPYRDKMNTMKAERKGKATHTEKTNTHFPPGWRVHSTFAYGDVPDPLKMYRGKGYVEKFVE